MATAISEFEKYVSIDVIDCPDILVTYTVQRSIAEFCDKSGIFTQDLEITIDPVDIDSSINDFYDIDLTAVTSLRPIGVIEINIDGTDYTPAHLNLLSNLTNFSTLKDSGTKYFSFPDAATLRLYDISSSDEIVFLKVIFAPYITATTFDDLLFQDWGDAIIAGAKYRLLSMPGKIWTNEKAALHNQHLFRSGITQAAARVAKGFTRNSLTVQPQGLSMWGV